MIIEFFDFIVEAEGPSGIFGVFESEEKTGYLYLFEPGGRKVFSDLHIYNRTENLSPRADDVSVVWSNDFAKCGVVIFGALRGVIYLQTGQKCRPWFANRDTPGIVLSEVVAGFHI